jgi:6-pyruvoyl-tetrahydropterin synthase
MGMVVDFGDIKEWFRGIEANFDHTLVLGKSDYEALERLGVFRSPAGASTPFDVLCQALGYDVGSSDTPRLGIQRVPYNMTAERFAEDLYKSAAKYFTFGGARRVEVDYVRVYEQLHPTESYAEYRPSKTESLNPRGGRPLDVDGEPQ